MSNERGKEAKTVQPQRNIYENLIAVYRTFLVFLICAAYVMEIWDDKKDVYCK